MSIEKSLKKILFSAPCVPLCENTNCEHAVAQLSETGNWYITFGHAGFNSIFNNGIGYSSKEKAMAAMRRYLKK